MNGYSPDQDPTAAALDRLDAALERIAKKPRPAPLPAAPLAATPLPATPLPATPLPATPPQWAREVASRLDALIGDLRRVLSGEQN